MTTPEPARFRRSEVLRPVNALAPHRRIDTLDRRADVVRAMITGQSVNNSTLWAHLPGTTSRDVRNRRTEQACREEQRIKEVSLTLLLFLRPEGPLLLSLDRMTWAREKPRCTLLV